MDRERDRLTAELRGAGLSRAVIDAAWPSWWSDEAASSPSGRAELRFALARRLGLSPRGFAGERVEFVWNDEARFKNLTAETEQERGAIASFGVAVGRLLVRGAPEDRLPQTLDALAFRQAILISRAYVDLHGLVAACWAFGIPVVHLRVFPLERKSMHAMVVRADDRHAILLARQAAFPALTAFTLAHELGHVLLGHVDDAAAVVDLDDPSGRTDGDGQEEEANAFALTLLTGTPRPAIDTGTDRFTAAMLASAVARAGPAHRVDPGTLALCVAHQRGAWSTAMSALRVLPPGPRDVADDVNAVADGQLDWAAVGEDGAEFARRLLALDG